MGFYFFFLFFFQVFFSVFLIFFNVFCLFASSLSEMAVTDLLQQIVSLKSETVKRFGVQ